MALCLLPGPLASNQVQEVIPQFTRQDIQNHLIQMMIKMTKEQQQIQFSSAASIADRIVNHLQIQDHRPQKMRLQRGLQRDLQPEMVTSEEGGAIQAPPEGDEILPHESVVLPLLDVGAAHLPHRDAAGLLLPGEGHHLHFSEDDPHPRDATLLLFSAALAHHLCPLKKENCPVLPQGELLLGPNADPLGHPNEGALLLRGGALLLPQHLHPDTGGAQRTHPVDQKGIAVLLHLQQTAVATLGALPAPTAILTIPHPTIENKGLQITKRFEECLERQNLGMSRAELL